MTNNEPFSRLSGSVEEFAPLDIQRVRSRKDRDLFKDLLSRYHYLGYAMPFGARLQYLVHVTRPCREVVGCIQFSSPAWRMKARDQWIGWNDERRQEALQQVVNNSRFLVLAKICNPASSMLSATLAHLRSDWEEQYGVAPILLETLVDQKLYHGGHGCSPGTSNKPVRDADGLNRTQTPDQKRRIETVFGRVELKRAGYAEKGCKSLHPLDGELNLPPEIYSLELQRKVAEEAAKNSFEEVVETIAKTTVGHVAKRLSKGEKKNAKRMATVAAVYTTAPFDRTPEDLLSEGGSRINKMKCPPIENKRVWASLEKTPEEVIIDAFSEAENRDPNHEKTWVARVDGNNTQINILRKIASSKGISLTIIVDVIHVIEYLWEAGRAFHPESGPELEKWVQHRLRKILQGKAGHMAGGMRRSATRRNFTPKEAHYADGIVPATTNSTSAEKNNTSSRQFHHVIYNSLGSTRSFKPSRISYILFSDT